MIGAETLAAKNYTTKLQRELLESVGVPHEKGRSREKADEMIQRFIDAGKLPKNCLIQPTEKQLAYMAELGISIPEDLTKEQASALIDKAVDTRDRSTLISERQFDFIESLGGFASRRMNRLQARKFIELLIMNQPRCRRCGSEYDQRNSRCRCGAYVPSRGKISPPSHIYEMTFWESIASLFGF